MVSPLDRKKIYGPLEFVPYLYGFVQDPTTTDIYQSNGSLYPVGDQGCSFGVNKTSGQLFYLQSFTFSGNTTTANWVPLTSATPSVLDPIRKINLTLGSLIADADGEADMDADVVTADVPGADKIATKSNSGSDDTSAKILMNPAVAAGGSSIDNAGPASFSNSQFNLDENGFAQLVGSDGTVSTSPPMTLLWQTQGTSTSGVRNVGYLFNAGAALTISLPSTASSHIGDLFAVVLDGSTSWQITQAASQQIRVGNVQTTSGAGGSITSTATGDSLFLVYQGAGKWNAFVPPVGALTIV